MQVAGTDLPREPNIPVDDPLFTVHVADDLNMTTGKASAQAAHAAFVIVRDHLTTDDFVRFLHEPTRFNVRPASSAELADLAQAAPVAINDAGHTEVAPGSLTAVGTLA